MDSASGTTTCDFCKKVFKSKSACKNHIEKFHQEYIDVYTCPYSPCKKEIRWLKNFSAHYTTHAKSITPEQLTAIEKNLKPIKKKNENFNPDTMKMISESEINEDDSEDEQKEDDETGSKILTDDQGRTFEYNLVTKSCTLLTDATIVTQSNSPTGSKKEGRSLRKRKNINSGSAAKKLKFSQDQALFKNADESLDSEESVSGELQASKNKRNATKLSDQTLLLKNSQQTSNESSNQTLSSKTITFPLKNSCLDTMSSKPGFGSFSSPNLSLVMKSFSNLPVPSGSIHSNNSGRSTFDVSFLKNKVNLFNSIRRYLSPSLMALVRLQMFMTQNYEFRADEIQTSKELFDISQDAYFFLRNEWMIPLPSPEVINDWMNNKDESLNIC